MPRSRAVADRQIEAQGKVWTVRYSILAMLDLQDHFNGGSINDVGRRLADRGALKFSDLVAILKAGLRTHHPSMTDDEAKSLADDIGLEDMVEFIQDGLAAASPSGDAREADPPTPGPLNES